MKYNAERDLIEQDQPAAAFFPTAEISTQCWSSSGTSDSVSTPAVFNVVNSASPDVLKILDKFEIVGNDDRAGDPVDAVDVLDAISADSANDDVSSAATEDNLFSSETDQLWQITDLLRSDDRLERIQGRNLGQMLTSSDSYASSIGRFLSEGLTDPVMAPAIRNLLSVDSTAESLVAMGGAYRDSTGPLREALTTLLSSDQGTLAGYTLGNLLSSRDGSRTRAGMELLDMIASERTRPLAVALLASGEEFASSVLNTMPVQHRDYLNAALTNPETRRGAEMLLDQLRDGRGEWLLRMLALQPVLGNEALRAIPNLNPTQMRALTDMPLFRGGTAVSHILSRLGGSAEDANAARMLLDFHARAGAREDTRRISHDIMRRLGDPEPAAREAMWQRIRGARSETDLLRI
jgi:hypothetical protein